MQAKNVGGQYNEMLADSSFKDLSEHDMQAYYEKGVALHDMGEYIPAETAFLKAAHIAEKIDEKGLQAFSLHYLGRINSWKSNYSYSIHCHKEASKLFYELNNFVYAAVSNNHISFGYYAIGEYDSAIVYYKWNIENLEKIDSTYVVLSSYQNIASVYAKLFNYKQAYSYLQSGIEFAEKEGDKRLLAEIYLTTGRLFSNNHVNKKTSLEYLKKAKDLYSELNKKFYVNFASLYMGKLHFSTGNGSLALELFQDIAHNADSSSYYLLSQANHSIGKVYKSKFQYDSALHYLLKSIDVICNECPKVQSHSTLIEISSIYIITGDFEQAYYYLNMAKDIAVDAQSRFEMLRSYEEFANYYQSIQNSDSTIYYLSMAHELALELGLLDKIKETAEYLSKIYYEKKDFQSSANYLQLSVRMNDSLTKVERYNELAKLEMRFEIERKEEERKLEAQMLQSKIAKEKLIRNTLVVGTVLFLLIGILLLRAYRRKRKDNQLLAKQKKEIQEISKQLQESGKRKLDFFTNISHEIRTPLTLIKSPLERILKSDIDAGTAKEQLQLAINNTNKLKILVNQILDLQKLDEHKLGLSLSDFEIVGFCVEIVNSFEGICYQDNCNLSFGSNIGKASVSFDKERLQSILNNLLSNAFKFNKKGGAVRFNLEVNTHQLKLEISDTGRGISNEHLSKLGEKYYQVKDRHIAVEGTGIGLAYVKELVELMNGELTIASTLNKGTTVTIYLPVNKITIDALAPVNIEIASKERIFEKLEEGILDNVKNERPRILIVEDNFELRRFLHDLFSDLFDVVCAKDGLEGKELAFKFIPDLIISDIMMPGIQGNKLCRILKNNMNTSHITIILFTAKGAPDSIVDGYDCGADDYIVKPFDSEILVKKVSNLIATAENMRKQFNFSDVEHAYSNYSEFDRKFFKECISIIKNNLDNSDFTVECLAKELNIHRRTLLRKFKALTGKSPAELIRHSRMSHAAILIQNKKYRVNEVALMVGYEDSNRFSQAFKQFHGMPPSAFN